MSRAKGLSCGAFQTQPITSMSLPTTRVPPLACCRSFIAYSSRSGPMGVSIRTPAP